MMNGDREHIAHLSARDVVGLRHWLDAPCGSLTLKHLTVEAVDHDGGILVRTQPFTAPLDPEDIDPEAVRRAARATSIHVGPVRESKAPLPTTDDTVVTDACPSRLLDADNLAGSVIVHCVGAHRGPGGFSPGHTDGRAWSWSNDGAMPADQPCDKRCAQCVERIRDNLIKRAVEWNDVATPVTEGTLTGAINAYRKVMGL